jgi:hypothetical protein
MESDHNITISVYCMSMLYKVLIYFGVIILTVGLSSLAPVPVFFASLAAPILNLVHLYISADDSPVGLNEQPENTANYMAIPSEASSSVSTSKKQLLPPPVNVLRCIMVQACCFSGTFLNMWFNADFWVAAAPMYNMLSIPSTLHSCSSSSSSSLFAQPISSVYIFVAAFFFCGLMFHIARAVFSLETNSTDALKQSYFERAKGNTDTYFLSCFHM